MSWPLPSPAWPPPPATVSPVMSASRPVAIVTPTRNFTSVHGHVSGPMTGDIDDDRDARDAYDNSNTTTSYDARHVTFTADKQHQQQQQQQQQQQPRLPVGTTPLLDGGRLRIVPLPSPHPHDPLNLPAWRKWAAVVAMSVAGGMAVGAEAAFDNLLPVFSLAYAGVDPRVVQNADFAAFFNTSSVSVPPASINMTAALAPLTPPQTLPPTAHIQLLATLPLLTAAVASYVQVPLSEAVGRRPVLLLASACAWAGALWAGLGSVDALTQHVAARALIGVGAGATNALVPLVAAHDLFFLHQRHCVLAVGTAVQALVAAVFVAAAPSFVVATTSASWRWLYYMAALGGFVAWLGVVALVPETRWTLRTRGALCAGSEQGTPPVFADNLPTHQRMARLDYYGYGQRTLWTDLGVFTVGVPLQWSRAGRTVQDLLRTTLLPPVLWVAALQAVLLVAGRAMAELTVDAILLRRSSSSSFSRVGLVGIIAAVGAVLSLALTVVVVGDRLALGVTRHLRARQPSTAAAHREAEHNLPGLVLPLAMGIASCFFFGVFLSRSTPSILPLIAASSLLATALFLVLVGTTVYLVESFPLWAGPCLVHATSLRDIAAFLLARSNNSRDSFRSLPALLVARKGALAGWSVFAEALLVLSLGLPVLFVGGRRLRAWAAGTVQVVGGEEKEENSDEKKEKQENEPQPVDIVPNPTEPYSPTPPHTSSGSSTISHSASSFPMPPQRPARYTAPHPGTRANIVFPHDSLASQHGIAF